MNPPFIERHSYNDRIELPEMVSGQRFFEFFERKRIKMFLAWTAGIIGTLGNFHAVRYWISQTRFDMAGMDDTIDFYAFGLTALLEMAIVFFHLTRIKPLTIFATVCAVSISAYANLNLMIQNQSVKTLNVESSSNLQFGGSIIVGIILAILPIVILTYMMHLVMHQYDSEMRRALHARKD
jgi:hypothetical protein